MVDGVGSNGYIEIEVNECVCAEGLLDLLKQISLLVPSQGEEGVPRL
jgi:hypothetical protein